MRPCIKNLKSIVTYSLKYFVILKGNESKPFVQVCLARLLWTVSIFYFSKLLEVIFNVIAGCFKGNTSYKNSVAISINLESIYTDPITTININSIIIIHVIIGDNTARIISTRIYIISNGIIISLIRLFRFFRLFGLCGLDLGI